MRRIVSAGLLVIGALPFFARAQSADVPVKISKTRTGKAIIHYDPAFNPKPGEYFVLTKKGVNAGSAPDPKKFADSRNRILGIRFDLSFLNDKVEDESSSRNVLDTELKYGWNEEKYEFGPTLGYRFTRWQEVDEKSLLVGGFFDYNFTPNSSDVEGLFGLRVTAAIGQLDHSAQEKAADLNRFTAGVVYKWFGLSSNFAFDIDLSYMMQTMKLETAKTETTGLVGKLGLQTYF